jgi:hypothetical protein
MLSTSKAFFRNPSAGGGAADPSFAYVPLLLETTSTNGQQNNTFLDSSTNNFTITRNGTPTQGSITPYWPNGQWSNYFNGTNAYLTSTVPALSGQFTIDFWLYRPASGNNYFFTIGDSLGSTGLEVYIGTSGTAFNVYSNNATQITSSTLPSVAAWNYVAVTRDASNVVKMYLNGTQVGSTWTTSVAFATTLRVGVEFYNSTVSGYGNNYISNFRISNNVRTVTSVPTAPFSQDANTLFLGCQSNRFKDNSSNNATITSSGTPTVQAFQPFSPTASYTTALYGGSGYFNGSTDELNAGSNAAFAFGSGAYTVEFWTYLTAAVSVTHTPCFVFNDATGGWGLVNANGGNQLQLAARGGALILGSATTLTANTWSHVVVVRSGTGANQTSMFVNGTRIANGTDATNWTVTGPLKLAGISVATYYLNGYLSNVRIVKGTAVYDPTQTTLTVPTSPLTAISGTSFLANFTNAGIYDASAQNLVTTVGDAQASTTQYKWSPTSMKFDGTGDYLNILPVLPSLTLGTSNFTIEGWVYFNTVAGFQFIFDQRPTATNGAYPLIYMSGANMIWYVNTAAQITSGTLSTGVWYYFAVTRSSSVTKMFINGSQVGSNYSDTNNYLASKTLIGISTDSLGELNGYLQDFRITKGIGRTITASPTAAFPTR